MSKCVAITVRGIQCKNNKKNKIFCGIHIKSKPNEVALDGGDDFGHITKFTDEQTYFKQLEQMQLKIHKHNEINDQKLIKAKEEAEAKYNAIRTCCVCYEEMPNREDLIGCSHSCSEMIHLVCNSCLQGHINSMLSDGIASLDCMFNKSDKCGGTYNEIYIQKAIGLDNKDMLDKWSETIITTEIVKLASICDNYMICPLCCKWGCIFEAPAGLANKHAYYIPCGKCGEQWCTLCKRKSHNNRTCYELQFTADETDEIKANVVDKMLQDITTRTLTHCCTICGCTYIKDEGCNLMTCPKCNGMSCYICGMKLYIKGNTKYWHFTGHDLADREATCPLWNNHAGDGKANQGNTEYNMQLVEREFLNFITANKNLPDSRMIIKLIRSRIITLFSKDKEYKHIVQNIRTGVRC